MKKELGVISFIIALCVAFGSCSSDDTYADKLKKERKAISSFISGHDIVVLKDYPSNGVFKSNEYYRDPGTGIYINVVDTGNGNRVSAEKRSEVSVRFKDAINFAAEHPDTVTNTASGTQPISITYGIAQTYTNTNSATIEYIYASSGIVVPLNYVGEKGKVKLIVPFSAGSIYQQAAYTPLYYGELQYTKIVN